MHAAFPPEAIREGWKSLSQIGSSRIARDDKRTWVVKRRERTLQLIELGGLVAKPGLVELTDDDRAVISCRSEIS